MTGYRPELGSQTKRVGKLLAIAALEMNERGMTEGDLIANSAALVLTVYENMQKEYAGRHLSYKEFQRNVIVRCARGQVSRDD